jgi:hypothetical protein
MPNKRNPADEDLPGAQMLSRLVSKDCSAWIVFFSIFDAGHGKKLLSKAHFLLPASDCQPGGMGTSPI